MLRPESFLGCIKLETFGRFYGWFHLFFWISSLIVSVAITAFYAPKIIKDGSLVTLTFVAVACLVCFCLLALFILISRRLITGASEVS